MKLAIMMTYVFLGLVVLSLLMFTIMKAIRQSEPE